jgi:hypothetical protein
VGLGESRDTGGRALQSGAQRGRGKKLARETASGPRMSGSSSSPTVKQSAARWLRPTAARERGSRADVVGWPENHGTAVKHRCRPSSANRAKTERK